MRRSVKCYTKFPMKMGLLMAALVFWATSALAQDAALETVTVTADPVRLIEAGASDAALGLAKPLAETPRAVTLVSDTTLSRYGIDGVDALTAITPNAYTGSFYGVEGAVNLRGTQAESYFRGFKRAENRGTYATPLGDAARIDILRGPPSPAYGAGKVGGLVNFIPKSQAAAGGAMDGELTVTYGSYAKRNLTGQAGVPLDLGFASGGVRAYGEMVALLRDRRHVASALEPQALWNRFGVLFPFSLLCGYPFDSVAGRNAAGAAREVSGLHSSVIATRSFPAELDSVREARHVTADVLDGEFARELAEDAAIVVTELASNAVLHAGSGFTLTISRAAAKVRIAVQDDGPLTPRSDDEPFHVEVGHGLSVVAQLACAWDVEVLPGGKVVWAELAAG